MKRFIPVVCFVLCSVLGSAAVNVTVTAPSAPTATVSTAVRVVASATSRRTITGWAIYSDGKRVWSTKGPTSKIDRTINLAAGTHKVVVRAWDSRGAYDSAYLKLTAIANTRSSLTPPSTAVLYNNIDQMNSWGDCRSLDCSGSDAWAKYWIAQSQTAPSLDGASTKFYMSGNSWADVLWWKKLGGTHSAKTRFLLEFHVKPGADTLNHTQALEYDVVLVQNGRKWDFSHQFHYTSSGFPGYPHWDTWDGQSLQWVHTDISVPKLDPNKWSHVAIYGERVGNRTHNISVTVNGTNYPVPDRFAWHDTRTTSWQNHVGVQVQMDLNGTGGTSSQHLDKLKLYLW
ncbi:MAG TPA: hypothetical protein VD837_13725 [Terriglobales bacterium]|nr:hypothetical protein [Terriglobales bacterium]